jgi:hypothetical protein
VARCLRRTLFSLNRPYSPLTHSSQSFSAATECRDTCPYPAPFSWRRVLGLSRAEVTEHSALPVSVEQAAPCFPGCSPGCSERVTCPVPVRFPLRLLCTWRPTRTLQTTPCFSPAKGLQIGFLIHGRSPTGQKRGVPKTIPQPASDRTPDDLRAAPMHSQPTVYRKRLLL